MKITTMWVRQCGDNEIWLASAYDEFTADVWNGVPPFYTEEIERAVGDEEGIEMREIVITVSLDSILDAFDPTVVTGEIE